MKMVEKNK